MRKKKMIQKIGGRKVIYWMTYENGKEMHGREYVASMEVVKTESGGEHTAFNVEVPEHSLKGLLFIGEFDNFRELEAYCSDLVATGEESMFVAHVATDKPFQYVVINPTGKGPHLYYIMIEM